MTVHFSTIFKSVLLSSCFMIALPVFAQAQSTNNTDTTEQTETAETTTNNRASPDAANTVLDTVVVTGTSVATNIRNAPASISVIGQEQLQNKGAADISEVLRTVPGLNVGFGSDGTRGISMRGLGDGYTLILIDGKRVNAGLTTLRHYRSDLDWVPVEAIDRIEVVRGPMSTLYGSDALGGVINIITKKSDGTWHGSSTIEWIEPDSNYNGPTLKTSGRIAGALVPDTLQMSAYASFTDQDPGTTDNIDVSLPYGSENYNLDTTFTWTPIKNHVFDFQVGKSRDKYKNAVASDEAESFGSVIDKTNLSVRHVGDWGFGTSTINAYYEDAVNGHDTTDRAGNITGYSEIDATTYTIDGKLSMPLEWWLEQDLTIGAEYKYEDLNDPDNLGKDNTLLGTSGTPEATMWTAALFAEDQVKLTDMLKMTLGLRMDQHEKFGTHFSPRVYFNYDINDNWSIKTGWAQAFKAPDLRQLNPNWVTSSRGRGCGAAGGPCEMVGNPDLKPETSNSFEIGAIYNNELFDAGITYFYNDIKDKITSARVASLILPNGKKYVQQLNVDQARSQGFEGSFNVYFNQDWTWSNTMTYLLESRNLATNQPLTADPEYALHTELQWKAREDLTLIGSWDFYGKQVDLTLAETLTAMNVSAYNIANFAVKYSPNDNVDFRVGVSNIFDQQPDSESNFSEFGRSYFVSFTSKF